MRRLIAATGALATLATFATLAACGGAKQPDYAKDGATGAAAPATQQSLSPNPTMGDSTTGVSRGTGAAAAAGDTAGAYNKAAGAVGATPGQPTSGPNPAGHKAATGAPRP
jgi:predicted small lipoprotein YifL